ncbi:MAG: lysylphosphatidylglycerol synthase transmembrane domain-containing protein [Candidatus Diapherotrites archaeon]
MALKKYFALIGIALFIFILLNINIPRLIEIFSQINLFYLFVVLVLVITAIILKAFKWQQLIKAHGSQMSLKKCINFFLIGFFASVFTPARAGDLLRVFYAGEEIKSKSTAFSSVVLDRIIDIGILICLGVVSILVFSFLFGVVVLPLEVLFLGIFIFMIAVIVVMRQHYLKKLLKPLVNVLVPEKHKPKLAVSYNSFYDSLSITNKHRGLVVFSIFISLLSWFLVICMAYFLLLSLGVDNVPFYFMAIVVPIVTLIELVPITISGLGTREAAMLFVFSFYPISAETIVAYSLLYVTVSYWFMALIGAIVFSTTKKHFSLDFF